MENHIYHFFDKTYDKKCKIVFCKINQKHILFTVTCMLQIVWYYSPKNMPILKRNECTYGPQILRVAQTMKRVPHYYGAKKTSCDTEALGLFS